jgi:uncharacterized protein (TIGR02118 family)
MIKLIVAVKRRPELSAGEFHKHWRIDHARLVKNNPATLKYVRKYVQCHTMLDEYKRGEVAYDGTAELWFDTVQDKDAFFSDPEYLKNIRPDESRFADLTRTVFFVTEEEAILDNPTG